MLLVLLCAAKLSNMSMVKPGTGPYVGPVMLKDWVCNQTG